MKKCLISIFAVFYLGLSCGFAIDIHFCMGKLLSVDLFHKGDNTCSKCGMKNREGCCNSKLTVVKITDSQQPSYTGSSIGSPLTAIVNYHAATHLHPVLRSLHAILTDTYPPPVPGAFRCILHSIFTI